MKKFICLISLVFLLNSSVTFADSDDLYFKLSGILSNISDSDMEYKDIEVGELKTEHGFGVSVAVGKHFGNVFTEIEYAHRIVDVDSVKIVDVDVTSYFEDDITSDVLMVNAGYEFGKTFKPYILAGIGVNWVEDTESAAFAYQVGAGITQPINSDLAIFAGYKYLGSTDLEDEVVKDLTYTFDSHNFEAGIKYSF